MNIIIDNLDLYWEGLLRTLLICAYGAVDALALGVVLGVFRVSPIPPLRWIGQAWVTVFRNCPLTVVLFFCAFGLPEVGIFGEYLWLGILALVLYTSAFVCEAVRSGINAVQPGQAEAARAIGLAFTQSLGLVILPQALRTVVPPLGSVLIAMVKNSALVGAFGVGGDLFAAVDTLTGTRGLSVVPVLIGVSIGYLIITLPLGALLALLERKVAISR